MKQADLDRAVARATGESVSTIKRLGFLLAEPDDCLDPESEEYGPYVIDWTNWKPSVTKKAPRRPRYEPAVA